MAAILELGIISHKVSDFHNPESLKYRARCWNFSLFVNCDFLTVFTTKIPLSVATETMLVSQKIFAIL